MNKPEDPSCGCNQPTDVAMDPRRGFLAKAIALLLGLLAGAGPVAAAVVSFLNPLGMKSQAGKWVPLGSLDLLPDDGTPKRVTVRLDRSNAWNRSPNQPVGVVYLRRLEGDRVEAFQAECVHAGCFVDYDAESNQFICPCHHDHFDASGKREGEGLFSLRDLDKLDVELKNSTEVWVQFQKFRTGTARKEIA